MGEIIMEESDEEKYLRDQIHTDSSDASIMSTINDHIGLCINKLNQIMNLVEHPLMSGMKYSPFLDWSKR